MVSGPFVRKYEHSLLSGVMPESNNEVFEMFLNEEHKRSAGV